MRMQEYGKILDPDWLMCLQPHELLRLFLKFLVPAVHQQGDDGFAAEVMANLGPTMFLAMGFDDLSSETRKAAATHSDALAERLKATDDSRLPLAEAVAVLARWTTRIDSQMDDPGQYATITTVACHEMEQPMAFLLTAAGLPRDSWSRTIQDAAIAVRRRPPLGPRRARPDAPPGLLQ